MPVKQLFTAVSESSVRVNVLLTMVTKVGAGVLNFAAAPIYLRLVGPEGYGLIGFFVTLQGVLQILEVGLTTAASRQVAIQSVRPEAAQNTRDFIRTMEVVYWAAALALSALSPVVAAVLTTHWLRFDKLSSATITSGIVSLVISIAVQWPGSLYMGGLMALQKQVLANAIYGVGTLARTMLSIGMLLFVTRSIVAFCMLQAAVTVLTVVVMAAALWSCLPRGAGRANVRTSLLRATFALSVSISGVSLFSTCLNQADKVVLSRYLPLSEFGYYMLACTLAGNLYMLVTPICASVFPKLSQYAGLGDVVSVNNLYAKSVQLVTVMLAPGTVVIAFFAGALITIWTREPLAAQHAATVAAILAPASLASGYLEVALSVQRAFGWIRYSLIVTGIAAALAVPVVIGGVKLWGPAGGACAFLILKGASAATQIAYTDRTLQNAFKRIWNVRGFAIPVLVCAFTAGVCRLCFAQALQSQTYRMPAVFISLALIYVATALATPSVLAAGDDFVRSVVRRYTRSFDAA